MTFPTLAHIRAALSLPDFDGEAAQRLMAPRPRMMRRAPGRPGLPRQAGVLLLLFPADDELAFALVHRAANPHDVHSGQIGLPGGAQEAGETPEDTALREAQEELGLSEPVALLGRLTSLYIPPSDFMVVPVVGHVAQHPAWQPDDSEVEAVVECPVAWLLDDTRKMVEDWPAGTTTMQVPWYNIAGHKVWGATAIILSELEQRLRTIQG